MIYIDIHETYIDVKREDYYCDGMQKGMIWALEEDEAKELAIDILKVLGIGGKILF